MNTKKFMVSLIFTILISLISVAFYGVLNFVLFIFTDIARAFGGESSGILSLSFVMVLGVLISALCIANIIIASISFKHIRNNGKDLSNAKKKILAITILLFIMILLSIIFLIFTFNSILLMILILLFMITYLCIAVVFIKFLKQLNNNTKVVLEENIESN